MDVTQMSDYHELSLDEIAAELTAWFRGLAEGLREILDRSDDEREAAAK